MREDREESTVFAPTLPADNNSMLVMVMVTMLMTLIVVIVRVREGG